MIRIIGAISLDRGIGVYPNGSHKKGRLPWEPEEAKGDLEYFKELTKHHSIIMGRKTFESIDRKPLTGRKNFIISSKSSNGCLDEHFTEHSIGAAIDVSTGLWPSNDIWIIGGERIFNDGMKYADEIILTIIPIKAYEEFSPSQLVYFPCINKDFYREKAIQHPLNPDLQILFYKRK